MRPRPAASVTFAVLIALTLALSSSAVAAPSGSNRKPGGGGGKTCTRKAPAVVVDNTWAWAAPGSFGTPGQKLEYALDVINYDTGLQLLELRRHRLCAERLLSVVPRRARSASGPRPRATCGHT
jgi:hypothetical protein